jgi:hypothetical protein
MSARFIMALCKGASSVTRLGKLVTAVLSVGVCLVLPNAAMAALRVSVQSIELRSDDAAFLDVFVSSDSGDLLDIFGLELQIVPVIGSGLEFTAPPLDRQVDILDPAYSLYLFTGDSAAASLGPPAGLVSMTIAANDTYIGGDGTLSGLGISVPTTDTLLARIQVVAPASAALGDLFIIRVNSGSSTFFVDRDGNDIAFAALEGTVSIVPEPASLCTLGGLLSLIASGGVFRRRKNGKF